jgi:hypothetical protein
MGNINDFTSRFGNGARSNLFEIELSDVDGAFFCKGAQIPGRTVSVVPLKYLGLTLNIAGETTFPEWTVTVFNDEGSTVRTNIENWMEDIRRGEVQNGVTNFKYLKTANVVCFDPMNNQISHYTIANIFPTDLGPIDLSWDSADTIQEYTITFAYSHWKKEGSVNNNSVSSIIKNIIF